MYEFFSKKVFELFSIVLLLVALPLTVYFSQKSQDTRQRAQVETNAANRPIPSPLYGVTIDSISNLSAIVNSLQSHSRMPTTRIVFDENIPASNYTSAVNQIYPVSYIMGEILDSFYVKNYTLAAYKARTAEYLDAFQDKVDIWEVGNEINGEWLGNNADLVAKMTDAYNQVKARRKIAELTLYYNPNCWSKQSNEMFTWAQNNIPADMKQGLDYVLISYYEDDCNGYHRLQPLVSLHAKPAPWEIMLTIGYRVKLGFRVKAGGKNI